MKKWMFVLGVACVALVTAWGDDAHVVVQPKNTDEALINPGMGWVCFHYSNRLWAYGSRLEAGDTLDWFPGASVIYFRLPWCYLEPEEGMYRWDLIDSYAQPWVAQGKRIALRVTACENRFRYATPEWVQKAGAKGLDYKFSTLGKPAEETLWEPDYLDPVFLEKLDRLLAAMAKRYNGNPSVAFIDIGTFGMWGEGHTGGTSKLTQEETDKRVKVQIDLYKKHFPDTQLCISDDVAGASRPGDHFPSTDYAFSKGVTLRDDSILVQKAPKQWYHAGMAQQFWPTLPVIIEHEHYGLSKERNAWDPALLLESVEQYHASYMSIHWWPDVFLKENRDAVNKINRRLGYRLELREVSYPKEVRVGEPFSVDTAWANVGVAPCYPGGNVTFTLKNSAGKVVWVSADGAFDVRALPVAAAGAARVVPHASSCAVGIVTPIPVINDGVVRYLKATGDYPFGASVPTVKPGVYGLYVSVGKPDGTPVIALPLENGDGARRYKVGEITVKDK
ncbi:MAG TPA: DUF4832 domain-containing protein [Kiritimatiellia bacterium]|nr:DUF4832 domain-containing protein [Kiritimatiellia bacterium]HPS07367.1 DUF4832 domain-containing protein [Kiritimatiellia bacterium]